MTTRLPKNVSKREHNNIITYRYYSTNILIVDNNNKIATFCAGYFFTKSTARHMKNMFRIEGYDINISFAGNRITANYNGKIYHYNENVTQFEVDI